jgi:hypothetical protein
MSNLIARLAKATLDLRDWETDKRHQQGYGYISADAVLTRAGRALGDHGVVVVPSVETQNVVEVANATKSGGIRFDATVVFNMTVCGEDGEAMVQRWVGMGTDFTSPEKALYKAITGWHKYFLMKLLNIGVGNEDGEHDEPQPQSKAQAQPAKKEKAANWYASAPSDKVKFVEFIAANVAHLSDPTVAMTAIKAVLDGANFTDKNKAELAQTVAQWQPPAPLSTDQLITTAATNAGAFSTQ